MVAIGEVIVFQDKKPSLKRVCRQRIAQAYPSEGRALAKSRLDDECKALRRIRGGERAFLEAARYVDRIKKLCAGAGQGYAPRITYRGSVAASLIAYLRGMTEYDPMELGFDPWTFYDRQKALEFNMDIPIRAVRIMNGYDLTPPRHVILRLGRDASVVELTKGYIGHDAILPDFSDSESMNQAIKEFFGKTVAEDAGCLKYLSGYDDQVFPEVYDIIDDLRARRQLPSNLRELAALDGFIHSALYDANHLHALDMACRCSDGSIYETLISSTESVYYRLVNEGCDTARARGIARKIKSQKQRLHADDMVCMVYYCGQDYMEMASNVKHLYSESQCFQSSRTEVELMYLIGHYRSLTAEAYSEVRAFERP